MRRRLKTLMHDIRHIVGEFGQIGLARITRRPAGAGDQRRVPRGNEVREDRSAAGCGHAASSQDVVLQQRRDAVQRPAATT